jgi:rare lipoprotein A (peptidoglycan hydrolase)
VLIAALASVAVPGLVGSRIPSVPAAIDPSAFREVGADQPVTDTTTPQFDPQARSAGRLNADAVLGEPAAAPVGLVAPRPVAKLPAAKSIVQETWKLDSNISWYGPGFYGHNGACGMMPGGFQPDTVGVAHRTLPCGTKVTFRYNGRTVTTRVIDRGPYVAGRIWDMTHGLCTLLGHCFTGGGVYYRIG